MRTYEVIPTTLTRKFQGTNEASFDKWAITTYQTTVNILQDGEYERRKCYRRLGPRMIYLCMIR